MITYISGNLFESPAHVLVNTVNTVGVMGRGIAKTFKRIYPEMFSEYQVRCQNQKLQIGNLFLYKTNNKWILNFPTKRHWRNPSRPEYIDKRVAETGVHPFVNRYPRHGNAPNRLREWRTRLVESGKANSRKISEEAPYERIYIFIWTQSFSST